MFDPAGTLGTIHPAPSPWTPWYRSWPIPDNSRASPLRMLGLPGEEVESMAEGRGERGDPLGYGLRASRQGHHQDRSYVSGESPGEDRHRGVRKAARTQKLPVAGDLAVEERPNRFRRHVARAEPGASGGEHEVDAAVREESADRDLDLRFFVGHRGAAHDREPQLREIGSGNIAGKIGASSGSDAVAHRQYCRPPDRSGLHAVSGSPGSIK